MLGIVNIVLGQFQNSNVALYIARTMGRSLLCHKLKVKVERRFIGHRSKERTSQMILIVVDRSATFII